MTQERAASREPAALVACTVRLRSRPKLRPVPSLEQPVTPLWGRGGLAVQVTQGVGATRLAGGGLGTIQCPPHCENEDEALGSQGWNPAWAVLLGVAVSPCSQGKHVALMGSGDTLRLGQGPYVKVRCCGRAYQALGLADLISNSDCAVCPQESETSSLIFSLMRHVSAFMASGQPTDGEGQAGLAWGWGVQTCVGQ